MEINKISIHIAVTDYSECIYYLNVLLFLYPDTNAKSWFHKVT